MDIENTPCPLCKNKLTTTNAEEYYYRCTVCMTLFTKNYFDRKQKNVR